MFLEDLFHGIVKAILIIIAAILIAVLLIAGIALLTNAISGENSIDVGSTAQFVLPNGTLVEGEVEALSRWSESNYEIRVDGVTYCIHPARLVLMEANDVSE